MSAKPVRVNNKLFPTKTAATHAIRSILYRYAIGDALNAADATFMFGVLTLHPHAAQKIGCGVASFSVEQYESTRGFCITRIDGTRTDFSFVACLTPPSPTKEAKAAFRREIHDQIVEFRRSAFNGQKVICPITNDDLTDTLAHVDHDPPFEQLLTSFVSARGIDLEQVQVNATQDNDVETRLIDRQLAGAWQRYHRQHAKLRVVSKRANLSILRRAAR